MQILERKWSWKDAPGAISMALSPTRLLVGMLGLLVVELLGWLFGLAWSPDVGPDTSMTLVYIRLIVLAVIVLYVLYATLAVIGRSVYLELEEGEGLSFARSAAFLFTTGLRTAIAPLILVVFALIMWLLPMVGFLFGRLWPGLAAILFLPLSILVILSGMAALLAVFGLYVAPGSAGVRKSGALDTVLDTVDMLRGRGVFWGFILTGMGMLLLGVIVAIFYKLASVAVEVGAGQAPPQGLNMFSRDWLTGLIAGQGIAKSASDVTGWLWVVVLKIFQLLCNSFLLNVFAGSGVIGYLVGSEDEIVVVEEKKASESVPAVTGASVPTPARKEDAPKPKADPAPSSPAATKPAPVQAPKPAAPAGQAVKPAADTKAPVSQAAPEKKETPRLSSFFLPDKDKDSKSATPKQAYTPSWVKKQQEESSTKTEAPKPPEAAKPEPKPDPKPVPQDKKPEAKPEPKPAPVLQDKKPEVKPEPKPAPVPEDKKPEPKPDSQDASAKDKPAKAKSPRKKSSRKSSKKKKSK